MKSPIAPLVVAMTALLSFVSTAPTLTGAGIVTFSPVNHALIARKVPEYKLPWSVEGTCNAAGSCTFDKSGIFLARCKNSKCGKPGSKCIVAYSDTAPTHGSKGFVPGKEAKCPINTAGYEWEWPWIDHVKQDAWNKYKQCKVDAKALQDQTPEDKKAKKEALAKCEAM